jgi:hypothetical protein
MIFRHYLSFGKICYQLFTLYPCVFVSSIIHETFTRVSFQSALLDILPSALLQ